MALTVDAGWVLGANAVATAGSLTLGSSLKGDRFQAHVTATLNCPFIILFERQRADEAPDRIFVGEDEEFISSEMARALAPANIRKPRHLIG